MNKNTVYLAVFAVLCVLAGVVTGAAITGGRDYGRHPGRPGFREKAERFMGYRQGHLGRGKHFGGGFAEMLAARLSLSREQKIKVTEILEKKRQEIDKIGEGLREAISGIKEKGDSEIMGILTPQQQEKFKALQKEFKEKHTRMRAGKRYPCALEEGASLEEGKLPPPPEG